MGTCTVFVLRPQYLIPDDKSISGKDRVELENKIRTTWIQAISGLGLFVAAYSAWLNYQSSQRKLEFDQENSEKQLIEIRNKLDLEKENSEKNFKILDSKQITERFSKAVEQLGNESITVRLGGIYSLERIAEESSEKYHWTIMEVLTAFVREKSNDDREPDVEIPQDIQAALTVIGWRNAKNNVKNEKLYLHNTNLSGAELRNANLSNIYFKETKFNEANLYQAKFNDALLYSAEFKFANLHKADFTDANLKGADLSDAIFTGANLTNANIENAKFLNSEIYYFISGKRVKKENQITVEQILKAKNWDKAEYNSDVEEKLQKYLLSLFITTSIFLDSSSLKRLFFNQLAKK